jgi:hypothetical protein
MRKTFEARRKPGATRHKVARLAAVAALTAGAILTVGSGAYAEDEPATTTTESQSAEVPVYWSYWTATNNNPWESAQVGAGSLTPADGTIEGWAYSDGAGPPVAQPPRTAANFDEVCGNTEPVEGKKRVAVVVDYGTTAIAPSGETPPGQGYECAQVDPNANGLQVLTQTLPARTTPEGMVCGISGYPATGCSQMVSSAAVLTEEELPTAGQTTNQADEGTSSAMPFIIGGIVIVGLAIAAVVMSRRRNG